MGEWVQGAGFGQGSLQDLGLCQERGQGVKRITDLPLTLHSLPCILPITPPAPRLTRQCLQVGGSNQEVGFCLVLAVFPHPEPGDRVEVAEDLKQHPCAPGLPSTPVIPLCTPIQLCTAVPCHSSRSAPELQQELVTRQSRAGMETNQQQGHSMAGIAQLWQDERGPRDRISRQLLGTGLPGGKGIWRCLCADSGA